MGLKKLFKKKPGGTLFGNVLRGVTKLASAAGLPGAGFVSSVLPGAPPALLDLGQQLVSQAVQMPALPTQEIKWVASEAKDAFLRAGGTADQASAIGAAAFTAASLPPVDAIRALDKAQTEIKVAEVTGANSFGKAEIKTILNGALDGAKGGATDAYLNETDIGKQQKKDAINSQGQKIMPWVAAGLLGLCGVLVVTRNN